MTRSVAVLGAGIVGISCALHLAKRGFRVTLVDRREPGSETSFGNSGVVGRASIAPLSQPALWKKLPRYAANRDRAVRFGPGYPARELGWFVRFLANSRPGAFDANVRHLNALLSHALDEHQALLAGDSGLLRRDGWLQLFRTESGFEASAGTRALWYRHGVRFRILDRDGLRELEPHLGPVFRRAIWLTDIASVADPAQVCRVLAERFAAEGGNVLRTEARSVAATGTGVRIGLDDGELHADEAVVALGPWSTDLLAPLGYRLPVIRERGYHLHLAPRHNEPLGRPCLDAEGAYVVSPMKAGLRLTTGIEFSAPDAPPTPVQLESVLPLAREAFPAGGEVESKPWLGARPGTPDSLPVIGRAPRHPNLWFAFGHASIGFALGPATGRLIAQMMSGESPLVDPYPYAATRFRAFGFGR
ncbi:MAG: FAD-dependent oxidoreductase [Immundisolibacterales bacterium]|nr:FAD-dependent oxidoreductase [Immundisolibacterales bacterium]